MRTRFSALVALFLACSPIASAQITNAQIVPQQLAYQSFVGTFNLDGAFLGTLTLTRNTNGVVRGSYTSPALLNNSTCRGDSNGPGFLITCTQVGKPHIVISAAALPITLTTPNSPPQPQIQGYMYVTNLAPIQAETPMTMISFRGRRVS